MKKIKGKYLYLIFIISLFLILISALFRLNNITFTTISISLNLLLIIILKKIIDKFEIKYTKKEILILTLSTIIIYIFYITSILIRKFIYYWDYSCYYNIQIGTINAFQNGILSGIKSFISSTWSGEYGSFLSFFPQVIFNFTNKSINSYLISCVIVFIPYILFTYSILIKRIINIIKLEKQSHYLILSTIVLILTPIIHGSFIYGQPDLFGLVFIFIILSLTIDYDFNKIEIDRLLIIFLSTYMLTICRRWYIYWIITYYILYFINILINNIKDKNNIKLIMKHITIYGTIVGIIYIVTLFPFIKNTLLNNYSSSYKFYSAGGLLYELMNQFKHLGYLILIIFLGGLIYGLKTKEYRKVTLFCIFQYLMIITMFTRIQSMGIHHSLLLLPNYIYGIILFIICVDNNKRVTKIIGYIMVITILSINIIYSYNNTKSILFTDISIRAPKEENYEGIKNVTDWLKNNLDENNTAYMIVHNNKFNPDKFRNFYTPNSIVHDYLPYGSSIIGIHKFPIELFTAKYIITSEPFIKTSLDEDYNIVFNKIKDEKFILKKEFIMQDKTKIIIYERIKKTDEKEKIEYINQLKEKTKEYKELYEDVIKEYN